MKQDIVGVYPIGLPHLLQAQLNFSVVMTRKIEKSAFRFRVLPSCDGAVPRSDARPHHSCFLSEARRNQRWGLFAGTL